jgi:glycosyltransferase involved in cell wall biosynthesis
MRILISNCHRSLIGGIEKYLQVLLPGLLDRGHELSVVYEKAADPRLERIDASDSLPAAWCLEELGLEALLRSVARWKPDLVYSHGLESAGLRSALLKSYPTVLYAHNYYGTCATGQKCHAFPQAQPCTRRFGPMCLVLHYPRRCGGLHPATMLRMFRESAEINSQLPAYQSVLVASSHMHAEFQQHGVSPEKLHLVPLPAADSLSPFREPDPPSPRGRILFLGRLTKLKGGAILIPAVRRAAEKLSQPLKLTVGGDGPELSRLRALAQKFGITADFVGWVNASQKLELMRQTDLLAVPSLWPEPFGLAGVEAGSMGVPAVAYDVGGIPDWLIAGHSGELAASDPPTVDGLANAIVRALADPRHYSKLCRGAWEVASRFTLPAHLTMLEPILEGARSQSIVNLDPHVERVHI